MTEPQPSKSIFGARYEGLGIASTPLFANRASKTICFLSDGLGGRVEASCSKCLKFRSIKISFVLLKNNAKFPRSAHKNKVRHSVTKINKGNPKSK